jgi:hypothetical protein
MAARCAAHTCRSLGAVASLQPTLRNVRAAWSPAAARPSGGVQQQRCVSRAVRAAAATEAGELLHPPQTAKDVVFANVSSALQTAKVVVFSKVSSALRVRLLLQPWQKPRPLCPM